MYWKKFKDIFPSRVKDNTINGDVIKLVDGENHKGFMYHPPSDSLVDAEDVFSSYS